MISNVSTVKTGWYANCSGKGSKERSLLIDFFKEGE
jgi:hypothetical protein